MQAMALSDSNRKQQQRQRQTTTTAQRQRETRKIKNNKYKQTHVFAIRVIHMYARAKHIAQVHTVRGCALYEPNENKCR